MSIAARRGVITSLLVSRDRARLLCGSRSQSHFGGAVWPSLAHVYASSVTTSSSSSCTHGSRSRLTERAAVHTLSLSESQVPWNIMLFPRARASMARKCHIFDRRAGPPEPGLPSPRGPKATRCFPWHAETWPRTRRSWSARGRARPVCDVVLTSCLRAPGAAPVA